MAQLKNQTVAANVSLINPRSKVDWYLNDSDPALANVTSDKSNPALGIEDIAVYPVNRSNSNSNLIGMARVFTTIGNFPLMIKAFAANDGSTSWKVEETQSPKTTTMKTKDTKGADVEVPQVTWQANFTLNVAIKAQVLRYVLANCVKEESEATLADAKAPARL